jgi:hypothetical protein
LRCYSDPDGIKADLAKKLSRLELSRNVMVKCLDMALDLPLQDINNIIKNLSKNQLKSKFGQALILISSYKEENHL